MYKHLLKMADLTKEDIFEIFELAEKLKNYNKNKIEHPLLKNKTLGMIFTKASTRTRVSFEVGMTQLGGKAIFLSQSELQLGRGESIYDTAKVLSRYVEGIMIRTFEQKDAEDLAKYGSIPVINGLTDYAHPCQVLADLMTVKEYKFKEGKTFENLKLCFVGDGFNMANSLLVGGLTVGMNVSIANPKGYEISREMKNFGEKFKNRFTFTNDAKEAAKEADVLVTDAWCSMGQSGEENRKEAFKDYKIDSDLMKNAKKDAMVLHCLPAYKDQEISSEVFAEHENEIFDEAENRLHAQKAVMVKLMGQNI
ncbi:MAG: ornithine carbamoyltransferase [Oscillospiraceae bacterium]|nr:ornithine carbamoyltransferase [Oscillospiraceae bacterium]